MVSVNNERSVSIRYLWDYVPLVSTCVFFYETIHKTSSDPSLSIDPQRVRLIKWAKPRRIIAALPLVLNNFVVVFVDVILYLIEPPRRSRKRKLRLSPMVSETTLLRQRPPIRQRVALLQSPRTYIRASDQENSPPRTQRERVTRNRNQLASCLEDPEAHVCDGAGLGLFYNSDEETITPPRYTLDRGVSGRKVRTESPLNSIRIDRKHPDQGSFSGELDEKIPLRGE